MIDENVWLSKSPANFTVCIKKSAKLGVPDTFPVVSNSSIIGEFAAIHIDNAMSPSFGFALLTLIIMLTLHELLISYSSSLLAKAFMLIKCTVEPLHADTSLIRTPLYYGQFPMYRQNSHTFLLKKTSIIRTLSNTDNGHLISAPGGNFIQT